MIPIIFPQRIYLSTKAVDFRKGINGLCGEVSNFMGKNPVDGSLFVFYNRHRDKLKMLLWGIDGFWLVHKQLEKGTFELPQISTTDAGCSYELSHDQLQCILSGIELRSVRFRKRYKMIA
jgi:transposase